MDALLNKNTGPMAAPAPCLQNEIYGFQSWRTKIMHMVSAEGQERCASAIYFPLLRKPILKCIIPLR